MAINLSKLAEDLTHPDEDIRLLAMRTLCRLDVSSPASLNAQLLEKIKGNLERRMSLEKGDAQLFAQKAYEHLKPSFVAGPSSPPSPAETSRALADTQPRQAALREPPAAPAQPEVPTTPGPAPSAPPAGKRAPPSPPAALSPDTKEPQEQLTRLKAIQTRSSGADRTEVLNALEAARDPAVVSAALSALAAIGTPQDVAVARKLLLHKNDRVRANAVEAVERLGTPEQVMALLAPLANDRANRVRGNALKALGAVDAQSVLPNLESMLGSPDPETRATAIWVLGSLKGVEAVPLLARAAEDELGELRRRAAITLAPLAGPMAESLIVTLATDSEAAVRDAARAALLARKHAAQAGPSAAAGAPKPETPPRPAGSTNAPEPPPGPRAVPKPPSAKVTAPPAPAAAAPPQTPRATPPPRAVPKPPRAKEAAPPAPPAPPTPPSPAPGAGGPASGSIDFGAFDPEADVQEKASSFGREMDADARQSAPSRLMLAPELQNVLEGLYDQLDERLEQMGKKIWKMMRGNLINDVKLTSNSRVVQKAEAALEAHNVEAAKMGILKNLFSRQELQRQRAQLEFQLSEAFRRLGEAAIEQAHTTGTRVAGLEEFYTKADEIFLEVRNLKEGKP